jgi:predicted nucleic acid-binding protein
MSIFVDTNVFIYSFDGREPVKRSKARQLLLALKAGTDSAVVSTQVLQQFYYKATTKRSAQAGL